MALWDLDIVQCVWTSVHESAESVTAVTAVTAVSVSRDGSYVLSGTQRGEIAIWSMGNGVRVRRLRVRTSPSPSIINRLRHSRCRSTKQPSFTSTWRATKPG